MPIQQGGKEAFCLLSKAALYLSKKKVPNLLLHLGAPVASRPECAFPFFQPPLWSLSAPFLVTNQSCSPPPAASLVRRQSNWSFLLIKGERMESIFPSLRSSSTSLRLPPLLGGPQANLGLRRAKQCEDFLALASWLAMKEPTMTSNIMKSQLSRLYGQLYAFQVGGTVLAGLATWCAANAEGERAHPSWASCVVCCL